MPARLPLLHRPSQSQAQLRPSIASEAHFKESASNVTLLRVFLLHSPVFVILGMILKGDGSLKPYPNDPNYMYLKNCFCSAIHLPNFLALTIKHSPKLLCLAAITKAIQQPER